MKLRGLNEYYQYVRDNHIRLDIPELNSLNEEDSTSFSSDWIFLFPFLYVGMNLKKEVNLRRGDKIYNFLYNCDVVNKESLLDEDTDWISFKTGKDLLDIIYAIILWLKSLKK